MEGIKTLERAFEEAETALASADGKCVAVWPATAAGFVEELQVMTEEKWERLLRVGLKLAPDVGVRELYCFQNVSTCNGLTAGVLRLVQDSQSPPRDQQEGTRFWKLQQTLVVTRRKMEETMATKEQGGNSSVKSAEKQSPPRVVSVATSKTISPEEIQRKRRRVDEAIPLVHVPKCNVDEVRPPTKTRRLNSKGEKKRVVQIRVSNRRNGKSDSEEHSDQPEPRGNSVQLRRNGGVASVSPGLIAVDRGIYSAGSSTNISEEDSVSDTSDELESDVDAHEDNAKRELSPHKPRKTFGECDTLFATLQQVISAGLGLDSEDEDEEDSNASKSASLTRSRVASASSFKPFWSIFESASTILSGFCGLTSLLAAITAQDSMDYDLLWVEGEDQQHWTMFGEPRTPGKIGVKTR
ncbi:hypothetical protein PRIC1_007354 [Phytophthora ramorum]